MATAVGPDIVKDGLVFGYDTNYGVADINTSTKFFTGKPTSNLNSNPLFTGSYTDGQIVTGSAWGGDTGYGRLATNTSPDGGGLMYINHNTSNPAGSGGFYNDWPVTRYTLTNGYTYTRSWWAKSNVTQSFSGHMCSCNRDSTNTYIVGSSITLTPEWQKFSQTFTYSGATSTDWKFRHINYNNSVVYLANVQLEVASSYSPFVDGTRSDTGSLIDLKETTSIDVSNVSFDSTGQPTFDGTNDYIQLGNTLNSLGSVATFDMVFKSSETNDTYRVMIGWGHGNNNYSSIALGNLAGAYSDESAHVILNSSDIQMYVTGIGNSANWKDNKFHHMTVTVGANNYSIWIDGVERSFTFAAGSQATSLSQVVGYNSNITAQIGQRTYGGGSGFFKGEIPVMKIHNRILTDDEIKQNYNAYKNRFDI